MFFSDDSCLKTFFICHCSVILSYVILNARGSFRLFYKPPKYSAVHKEGTNESRFNLKLNIIVSGHRKQHTTHIEL